MKTYGAANRWMPVIGWALLIFVGSTDVLSAEQTSHFVVPFFLWLDPQMPVATMTPIHFALRKLGHLAEYAILAALLWCALRGTLISIRSVAIAVLFFLHLSVLPPRTNSPIVFPTRSKRDVMIDTCGATALALAWPSQVSAKMTRDL
jgi:VanZ family protein